MDGGTEGREWTEGRRDEDVGIARMPYMPYPAQRTARIQHSAVAVAVFVGKPDQTGEWQRKIEKQKQKLLKNTDKKMK